MTKGDEAELKAKLDSVLDALKAREVDIFPLRRDSSYIENAKIKCEDGFVVLRNIASVSQIDRLNFKITCLKRGYESFIRTTLMTKGSVSGDKGDLILSLSILNSEEKKRVVQELKSEAESCRGKVREIRQTYRKKFCNNSGKKKSDSEYNDEKIIDDLVKKYDAQIVTIVSEFDSRVQKL